MGDFYSLSFEQALIVARMYQDGPIPFDEIRGTEMDRAAKDLMQTPFVIREPLIVKSPNDPVNYKLTKEGRELIDGRIDTAMHNMREMFMEKP